MHIQSSSFSLTLCCTFSLSALFLLMLQQMPSAPLIKLQKSPHCELIIDCLKIVEENKNLQKCLPCQFLPVFLYCSTFQSPIDLMSCPKLQNGPLVRQLCGKKKTRLRLRLQVVLQKSLIRKRLWFASAVLEAVKDVPNEAESCTSAK